MSDHQKWLREYERAKKRQEREELRVAREIGLKKKRQERAGELERAQLEVDEYQAQMRVLLSLHREAGESWDWRQIAATLPSPMPGPVNRREMRALQDLAVAYEPKQKRAEDIIEEARKGDRLEAEEALRVHGEETAELERMSALARRILVGDLGAYRDALSEFCPVAELEHLGSSIEFIMHSSSFVECVAVMNDTSAIPDEVKTLTSNGKLSVKAMSRQLFHEIYQDHICSGVLRIAREVCALLPVEDVLVTVQTSVADAVGLATERPVLSVVVPRAALDGMNFARLDPSDTIETLPYCGDFKATRKTGAFQPIQPIKYEHVVLPSSELTGLESAIQQSVNLRNELKERLNLLQETSKL